MQEQYRRQPEGAGRGAIESPIQGSMQGAMRSSACLPLELDADWSYLRANLDHPAHRMSSRFGGSLADWLLRRLHAASAQAPQLSILARIALGPKQSLALVEAEGVHVLVGTAADGAPSFFSLAPERRSGVSRGEGEGGGARRPEGELSPAAEEALEAGEAGGSRATRRTRPGSRLRLAGRVSWV